MNNKGADQPVHLRSLISVVVVRCLDSIIPLVSISKISSLYLASVAAQAGLSLPWSQSPKIGFLMMRLISCAYSLESNRLGEIGKVHIFLNYHQLPSFISVTLVLLDFLEIFSFHLGFGFGGVHTFAIVLYKKSCFFYFNKEFPIKIKWHQYNKLA